MLIFRAFCSLLLFLFSITAAAQEPAASDRARTLALIKKLKEKREEEVEQAAMELFKIGPPAVPLLNDFLRKERSCRPRVLAAQLLVELAPKSEAIVPSMFDVVKNPCAWSPSKDVIVRRQAALVLVGTAAGIRALAGLLKSKSTFERRSTAFAFDDLTERLDGRPPEIVAMPEILAATKEFLPTLAQALNDKDEIVRCVALESLEQAQNSHLEALRTEASRLMQGIKANCHR